MSDRVATIAGVFDRAAATYDSVGVEFFGPIAQRLVDELAPRVGERVLDIGCGRGAVLLPAAQAVGPSGHVLGIDASPAMVEAARSALSAQELSQGDAQVMDAQAPQLEPASFDVLASSLVLFFLPDPAAAVASWRDVLVPGGRVGIATFAGQDPLWQEVDDVFRPYLPTQLQDARTTGAQGPFSSDEAMADLLAQTGYVDIRTTHLDVHVTFADSEHWEAWTWSTGQRVMWEVVPQDKRDAVRAEAVARLERCRDADGKISFDQRVRYTIARTPTEG